MTFLVTGGLGLIGHNIVQRLQARGEKTVIMDTKTTYGIIPQAEIDYLMTERLAKINNHPVYNGSRRRRAGLRRRRSLSRCPEAS